MKQAAAAMFALAVALAGCVPPPAPVRTAQAPGQALAQIPATAPLPLVELKRRQDCAMIAAEAARQRRIAEFSGLMATALVEASARLNAANVINALETRAAIEGCGPV